MESLKEIWGSLSERFKNPLLYSFAISWAIINYKVIVVLMSSDKYVDKFEYIENILYPINELYLEKLLYFPLLSSILYVFVLPAISLASTWAHAAYERLHSEIRANILRKAILTKEQRDMLEIKVAELSNALRREAESAKSSKIEAEESMSIYTRKIFLTFQPAIFFKLKHDASNWAADSVKPPQDRSIKGTAEQVEFVNKYGIPRQWVKVFEIAGSSGSVSVTEIASKLDLDDIDALNILFGLSALNMLKPSWSVNDIYFSLVDSSWVAFLNGRTM